jgi:hypothetical protein
MRVAGGGADGRVELAFACGLHNVLRQHGVELVVVDFAVVVENFDH